MSYRKIILKPFPIRKQVGNAPKLYVDGLTTDQRMRRTAKKVSGYGTINFNWWLYKFLLHNPLYGARK